MRSCFVTFIFACVFSLLAVTSQPASAAPPLSKENLKMLLEKFPNADSNKDGELTVPEAIAYYQKMLADRKKKPGKKSGPKPTHTNVSYGPDKRNVLDLWLVDSKKPTPLVIYIHGGGFVGGSKNGTSPEIIQQAHKRGISVAAINYRFVFKFPFPAPQHDGARAIQFLRHHAEKYNVDPNLFAAFGGSAGAGISMWLGYHDDLANPKSEDLIERASSRVCAVGSLGGQSTYDPAVIEQWVGGRAHEHPSIYYCYNVKTLEELADPKLQPLYDEVSAIKHLTKDDPPTYMFYNEENKPMRAGARPGEGIHHPIFGIKLQEALNKLNIESEFHNESNAQKILLPTMLDFFENQFAKQK